MKRLYKTFFLFLITALALSLVGCDTPPSTPSLELSVFSCGKADCMLLQFDNYNVLIDSGENGDGEELVKELLARDVQTLDLMILTHHDKDHIGGADTILENIPTALVRMPAYESDSKQYQQLRQAIQKTNTIVDRMTEDAVFSLGSAEFTIWVSSIDYDGKSDNEQSLVTKLHYGGKTILFTGDAEEAWLKELCASSRNLTCDILKLPHHGVYDKNLAALLALTLPDYVLITDSVKNPAEEKTMQVLDTFESKVYQTRNGSIFLKIESGNIRVTQ